MYAVTPMLAVSGRHVVVPCENGGEARGRMCRPFAWTLASLEPLSHPFTMGMGVLTVTRGWIPWGTVGAVRFA